MRCDESRVDVGGDVDVPCLGDARRRRADHAARCRRRLGMLMTQLAPRRPGFEDPDSSDRVAVWSEVDRLPLRQRQVLYLRYASDLAFDDIASILGVSASAARTHAS